MPLAYVILIVVLVLIFALGVLGYSKIHDWFVLFVACMLMLLVGIIGYAGISDMRAEAGEANEQNKELMTLLRLSESAQQRHASAHEGRFSTNITDLTQLEPRLVQPLADADNDLVIDLSSDKRGVVMTATAGDDDAVFKSTLRAGIGQRPVRGCDVEEGPGCENNTWR